MDDYLALRYSAEITVSDQPGDYNTPAGLFAQHYFGKGKHARQFLTVAAAVWTNSTTTRCQARTLPLASSPAANVPRPGIGGSDDRGHPPTRYFEEYDQAVNLDGSGFGANRETRTRSDFEAHGTGGSGPSADGDPSSADVDGSITRIKKAIQAFDAQAGKHSKRHEQYSPGARIPVSSVAGMEKWVQSGCMYKRVNGKLFRRPLTSFEKAKYL
jgi:hypothetical protein